MTHDLITRLRTACPPEYLLGKLCSEAADEIERIGRNRDMWRGQCDRQSRTLNEMRCDHADAIDACADRLKRAEELLKPFAENAKEWGQYKDAEPLVEGWAEATDNQCDLNVGHLRAAARFLEDSNAE